MTSTNWKLLLVAQDPAWDGESSRWDRKSEPNLRVAKSPFLRGWHNIGIQYRTNQHHLRNRFAEALKGVHHATMLPEVLVDRDILGQSRKASSMSLPSPGFVSILPVVLNCSLTPCREVIVQFQSMDRKAGSHTWIGCTQRLCQYIIVISRNKPHF